MIYHARLRIHFPPRHACTDALPESDGRDWGEYALVSVCYFRLRLLNELIQCAVAEPVCSMYYWLTASVNGLLIPKCAAAL